MIAALVLLVVLAVLCIVAFAVVAALFGLAVGGVVMLGVLAMKLLPVVLVGWLAMKFFARSDSRERPCLRAAAPAQGPSADDAWLDSRG